MLTLTTQHGPCVTDSLEADDSATQKHSGKAVLVHGGARDAYQLALALSDAGLLEALVTDLFWSEEEGWSKALGGYLPSALLRKLRLRSAEGLPQHSVAICPVAGVGGLLLDRFQFLPFSMRRKLVRSADAKLGTKAGKLATQTGAGLVSYSYFGYDAFQAYGRSAMLFQVHPHPKTMRRILLEELQRYPECKVSLMTEWELSLPDTDFEHLVRESAMASHYLVASSFTRDSLIENGTARESITVVPYGVDLQRFRTAPHKQLTRTSRLQLLFVGRINQRKGVKYLLEALQLLQGVPVDLLICGRVVDDLELFRPYSAQVEIRPSVNADDLLRAYQSADLFVFPSVGEGFGQVLLEALACGLPILSTTNTAAPDLIEDGREGFIVEPRRPDQLAERIHWAISHRTELTRMGIRARTRAEYFTWSRFRSAAAEAVGSYLATQPFAAERGAA